MAPYWADNDIRLAGNVSYEVHAGSTGHLRTVSDFVGAEVGINFTGTWMLLAEWSEVHPYPHGEGVVDALTVLVC